ncbi:putative serine O-acetyltransferase [Helianthus anomalus]
MDLQVLPSACVQCPLSIYITYRYFLFGFVVNLQRNLFYFSINIFPQAFKERDPSCLSYCSALLYLKGYHSLQTYRVAHALWNQGRKVLALALQSGVSEVFGVNIHPGIVSNLISLT